jgi:hypothetical protein
VASKLSSSQVFFGAIRSKFRKVDPKETIALLIDVSSMAHLTTSLLPNNNRRGIQGLAHAQPSLPPSYDLDLRLSTNTEAYYFTILQVRVRILVV